MNAPMIDLQAVVKMYGPMAVLRKLDLGVARGEFVALLGPNGAGKSTLLKLLAGLTRPNSGVIRVGGWELPREAAAVRAQLGLVSHESLLYDSLSAAENLRFFARLYDVPDADARIAELLSMVGLEKRARDKVRTFSRGMQQRLSIARALLHHPHVLLMDEPYSGLDQDAAAMLDGLLLQAHAEGHTILMVTHQLDRVISVASRVVIVSRGVVAYDAPTAGLEYSELASQYTRATNRISTR